MLCPWLKTSVCDLEAESCTIPLKKGACVDEMTTQKLSD